ncbi:MAG TPA: EAL domain-containing protein [Candidatus Baltobacteraceae bacterium]|nr:EAL domain-containing protein [Candidatus Baltobacteraceae bacterium]
MSTWLTDARAFESLFSASPSGIIALDSAYRVIAANPASTLISGYSADEFVGRDIRERANAPLKAFVVDAYRAAAAEKTLQRDVIVTRKDGSAILVEATSVPVADAAEGVRLFLLFQDTSWRQEAEQRFRSLFDRNPIPAAIYDSQGRIVEVNAATIAQSGYSREHFIGSTLARHCKDSLREAVVSAFDQALNGQIAHAFTELQAASGDWLQFDVTYIPRTEGGAIAGVYGLYENVTEERAAQRRFQEQADALTRVEREFRTIFEHLPTGVVAFDREQRIIDLNPVALELSGLSSRGDVVGGRLADYLEPQSRETVFRAFEQTLAGEITRVRAHAHGAGGNQYVFDVTHIPMYSGDAVVGVYSLLDNITGQERANEELAQTRLRFQLLFEHNPSVVLAIDAQQRIIEMNPAGSRISGYSSQEIRGRGVSEFIPPSQRDRVRQFLTQTMKGETATFSVDAYSADGRVIQYEATTLPIVRQGRIVGVYALMENVTERMRAERTVAAQREEIIDLEHDFQSLFAHNPDGICLLSTEGVILDINQAACVISNRPREEILAQNFRVFLQGPDLERGWTFFRRAVEGEAVQFEIASTRGDGCMLHLQATMFPKYAQGLVVGVHCAFQDVTERHVVHRKLEMQAQRMRDLYLLATTPEYTDAHVMSTLQTGCRLLGLESGAIIDSGEGLRVDLRYDSLELFAGNDELVTELAREVLASREPVAVHVGEPSENGYGTWIGSRLQVGGALHSVLLFFSRTKRDQPFEEIDLDTIALMAALVGSALERRRSRTHLRTLAYYDALTGLPNRLFFQERLRDALVDQRGHARCLAVLFFDLDRFKDINDTLGHAMGDRFLQMVAHRLGRLIGESGTVARMGGDEFILLLRDVESRADAQRVAEDLLHVIEEPFRIDGYEQFIATSIGIAISPDHGRDDQSLIKHADIAMYRMKDQGGNGFLFYDESFEAPLTARRTQEKHLRRAIQHAQFVLHYQPIIDVAADRIVSVEALVRWNHPQRGLVYPDEFIPVAEASGLVIQLGEWVIGNAAAQVRRWQEKARISLAVNISARQFHDRNLCDRLLELVTNAGFDPKLIEVEITESMALADVAHSIETVQQLKTIGAAIAVDDFGTGHSSLSYLRRFEVDHLKIDRSFVAGIGTGSSDETIVKAIIAMGHSLGLTVVAEGVENRRQFDFLKAHGCDRAQGYLFSRPVDAQALEGILDSWRGTAPHTG